MAFSQDEIEPGGKLDINIQTDGEARVGLTAVDRSVFILAENRLNLQQVFDELERLYMKPQAELHEVTIYPAVTTLGAKEIFEDAQVLVLSGNKIPEGKEYKSPFPPPGIAGGIRDGAMFEKGVLPAVAPSPAQSGGDGLAAVERVRQYFPENLGVARAYDKSPGESDPSRYRSGQHHYLGAAGCRHLKD